MANGGAMTREIRKREGQMKTPELQDSRLLGGLSLALQKAASDWLRRLLGPKRLGAGNQSKPELIHTSCRSESSNISLVVLDKDACWASRRRCLHTALPIPGQRPGGKIIRAVWIPEEPGRGPSSTGVYAPCHGRRCPDGA